MKVYHSYLKHKYLFDEKGVLDIPEEHVHHVNMIDNLDIDVESLKKVVNEEAEIIPELTIFLHEILDLLSRFELATRHIPTDIDSYDQMKLVIQRAQTFAVKDLLDEYFADLIEKIAEKAEVSTEFLKEIAEFNSPEAVERNISIQQEIMTRFRESFERQTGIDLNEVFKE